MQQDFLMFTWLKLQAETHPTLSPALFTVKLCLWGYTFAWGLLAIFIIDSLSNPAYSVIPLVRAYDDLIGYVAFGTSFVQLLRLFTHHEKSFFEKVASTLSMFWYYWLLVSLILFVPVTGPTFTAAVTLMAILSTVSFWNDPWTLGKT